MSGRYDVPDSAETQYEPESDGQVLRNRAGITSKPQMDQAEFKALVKAQIYYDRFVLTEDTQITAALLCQMHEAWLGTLYSWAGKYRTINVAKAGFKWPPFGFIEPSMQTFEQGLLARYTPCRPTDLNVLARQIAEVHAELLLIHPFRDGNGRLARWLADIMATQARFPKPRYDFAGNDAAEKKAAYIKAVQEGYCEDFSALTMFFVRTLTSALTSVGAVGKS